MIMWFGLLGASLVTYLRLRFSLAPLYWPMVGMFLSAAATSIAVPWYHARKRKVPLKEALAHFETKARSGVFPEALPTGAGYFLALMFCLSLAHMWSHAAGHAEAHEAQEFLVMHSEPSCIVVREYGDHFICAEFDSFQVLNKFRIIPLKDSPVTFTREKVGPLKHSSASPYEDH